MKKFIIPALVASSIIFGGTQAKAQGIDLPVIAIDDFSEGDQDFELRGPAPKTTTDVVTGGNILGGEREVQLDLTEGTSTTRRVTVTAGQPDETFNLSNTTGANSLADITYNGGGAGLNADLSMGQDFVIEVLAFDRPLAGVVNLNLTVTDADGDVGTVPREVNEVIGASDPFTFPFDDFGSDIDFDEIDEITLSISGPPAYDIELDVIGYTAIPGPAAIPGTILGGALLMKLKSMSKKKNA